jgi:hypothetical protein
VNGYVSNTLWSFLNQRVALNPLTFATFDTHVQRLCHVFAMRPTVQTTALPTAAFLKKRPKLTPSPERSPPFEIHGEFAYIAGTMTEIPETCPK